MKDLVYNNIQNVIAYLFLLYKVPDMYLFHQSSDCVHLIE